MYFPDFVFTRSCLALPARRLKASGVHKSLSSSFATFCTIIGCPRIQFSYKCNGTLYNLKLDLGLYQNIVRHIPKSYSYIPEIIADFRNVLGLLEPKACHYTTNDVEHRGALIDSLLQSSLWLE